MRITYAMNEERLINQGVQWTISKNNMNYFVWNPKSDLLEEDELEHVLDLFHRSLVSWVVLEFDVEKRSDRFLKGNKTHHFNSHKPRKSSILPYQWELYEMLVPRWLNLMRMFQWMKFHFFLMVKIKEKERNANDRSFSFYQQMLWLHHSVRNVNVSNPIYFQPMK